MDEQDKYSQNLVVKPRRKPVQVNPETEEAFEESKALLREALGRAAKTNAAFLAWTGIFGWRLVKHGFLALRAKLAERAAKEKAEPASSQPVHPTSGAQSCSTPGRSEEQGQD